MILVRDAGDGKWHAPAATGFQDEASIQALLEESFALMPGDDHPSVVVREFLIPGGLLIDLVAVDSNGDITLVECKLRSNPEFRHKVVGQLLSYAAQVWSMGYEEFVAAFEHRAGRSLASMIDELGVADWDEDHFREALAANLAIGRFRLMIVVDQISDELKRTIRYLNQHSTADSQFVALEPIVVRHEGIDIMLPFLHGVDYSPAVQRPDGPGADAIAAQLAVSIRRSKSGQRSIKSRFFWRRFIQGNRTAERIADVCAALEQQRISASISEGQGPLGTEDLDRAKVILRINDSAADTSKT